MFSRLQRFWTSIKVVTDMAVLAVAFVLAYATRFSGLFDAPDGLPRWEETLGSLVMVLVIFPVAFHQSRLYLTNRVRSHVGEVFEIFKATILASLILVAATYFTRERYSRLTLVLFSGYAFVLVAATRLLFRALLEEWRRRGHNLKSVLVVGADDLGRRVIDTVHHHLELGFRVVGRSAGAAATAPAAFMLVAVSDHTGDRLPGVLLGAMVLVGLALGSWLVASPRLAALRVSLGASVLWLVGAAVVYPTQDFTADALWASGVTS